MDQELVQYLDSRFQSVNRQFQELRGEMNEPLEEVKRHTGVLVEGLRHELHLVAEGLMTHIDVRHAEDRAYAEQRFQETNALVRLSLESTDHLRQRVENLERDQQN